MWLYLAVEVEGHCPKSMQKFDLEGDTFCRMFFVWLSSRKIQSAKVVKIEEKMREEGPKVNFQHIARKTERGLSIDFLAPKVRGFVLRSMVLELMCCTPM